MSFSPEQIIFLINPNSGRGKHNEILAELKKAENSIHYYFSKSKEDLQSFFSNLNKQIKVVVICGGDGTINSILKFAINTDLIFAVLPTGSGNGFAREMGFTKQINELLKIIKIGEIRKVDVLKINDDYCCNIAGIGFDSFIAQQFDESKRRGLISYIHESFKGFFKFQHFNATITANNTCIEGNYFMLTMANTRQFGNNVIVAPNAQPDDGLIDLVAIKKFSKIIVPLIVFKLLSRKGINSKYIQYLRAKKIVIKTDYKLYHIDGEPLTKNNSTLTARIKTTLNMIDATKMSAEKQ